MRIAVIGAGAMGCVYGGRLALVGADVTLLDGWPAHVDAINAHGLFIEGIRGLSRVAIPAATSADGLPPFDVALIQVDTNATRKAAETAAGCLSPTGFAMTLQNGIGNLEILAEMLGRARVMGGLSYHSAALRGPGRVDHTHEGTTWLGELDGRTDRLEAVRSILDAARMAPRIADDIEATIWSKFVMNCAINPICAVTGFVVGEIAETPPVDLFQTRIIEEILAVVRARQVHLVDADPMAAIKAHTKGKTMKPSMLQHIEAGRRTEIDSLNGAVVRIARELGLAVPFNEALTLLIKGLEGRSAAAH